MYPVDSKALTGITVADCFAGIGAFHLAFESFGAEVEWACEWDQDAADVYEANYGMRPAGDITKIEAASIPRHDVLCGGFPCQPFSISGNQKGFEDTRGTLFFEIVRIAKVKQPKIIFLENVDRLLTHDHGRTFQVIKGTLEDVGYDVFYKVLCAADFGVPQSRTRIFILATRKDLGIRSFHFPVGMNKESHLEEILLPDEETGDYVINRNDIYLNGREEFYCSRPLRLGDVNKGGQGERIYSAKGTAITLSAYGGGPGAKTGLYLVNNKIRRLAPRECARATGFPENFIIHANKTAAYRQFGNCIVVDVIQKIIEEMIRQGVFAGINNVNGDSSTGHIAGN